MSDAAAEALFRRVEAAVDRETFFYEQLLERFDPRLWSAQADAPADQLLAGEAVGRREKIFALSDRFATMTHEQQEAILVLMMDWHGTIDELMEAAGYLT